MFACVCCVNMLFSKTRIFYVSTSQIYHFFNPYQAYIVVSQLYMQECVKICALCDELKLRNSISNWVFLADTVDKNQNYQVCNIIVLYILAAIYGFVQVWALPILGRPNFAMCVQTCIYVHANTHTAKK